MNSKVMQVFYGADALPYKDKERTVHFPIVGNSFQGSQNTSEIKFYYDRIANSNTTLVAVARLPNGKIGSKVLESYYDDEIGENYVILELNGFYTQYKGEIYISLQGYQGGVDVVYNDDEDLYEIHGTPTIQATGSVRLNIQYATQFVGSGEEENADLQSLAAALGSKLNITSGIYVIDNISKVAETPDNYENGQLFYCLVNKQYYKKIAASPYYQLAEDFGILGSKNVLTRYYLTTNKTVSQLYLTFGNILFILRHSNFDYLYQITSPSNNVYTITALNLTTMAVYYAENLWGGTLIQSILTDTYKIRYVPYSGADEDVELGSNNLFAQALGIKTEDGYLGGLEKGDGDYDLVLRCDNGRLTFNADGGVYYGGYEIANKYYVDTEVAKKVDKTTTGKKVYGTDSSGNQITFDVDYTTGADGNIVRRASGTSQIMVPLTPIANGHACSKKYVDDSVASAISSVYRYKGSKTVAELNALTGQTTGDVYNVSDSGTLTGGVVVAAGDNVAWDGSAWDKLTSDIDLSVYYTKSETNTLLSAKANTANAVMDDDVSVSGGYVISIKRANTTYPIAQNVTTYFTPKVVATTSDLPAENDGFLYLVVADGYLYYWDVDTSAWVQGNEYATDLAQYVLKSQTIAGIDLSGNISAQALTDALVYATTSDIENIMED